MVKLENKNGQCQVIAVGDIVQISSEIGRCIHYLWMQLLPKDQEDLKTVIQNLMKDESPVWKREGESPVS